MDPKTQHSRSFLMFGLPLLRGFCWVLMFILGPLKRIGAYRVPKKGGVLVLSNHQSDLDPVIVQLGCKRPVYFMAKSELFDMKLVRFFLHIFKAFPVKRGEADRGSIKHAVELLKNGGVVCIYPEGELSETGELLPLKPGVSLIVRMAQVPVICCGISGSRNVMPYGRTIPRMSFRKVRLTWGETHSFSKKDESEAILGWIEAQLRMCVSMGDPTG